jgi:hypothetical protein
MRYPTESPKKAGAWLYDKGANVLSLDGKNPSPLTWKKNGWQDNRQDVEAVKKMPWHRDGVGVICGIGGVRCFDFDGTEEEGVKFGAVQKVLDVWSFPHTYPWIVASGSGNGFHVWFRCEDDDRFDPRTDFEPRRDRAFDHLELRWENHQTAVPPTVHPETGMEYEFYRKRPEKAPWEVSPDEVEEAIRKVARPKGSSSSTTESFDVPETINEGQRNNALASVAGTLRNRGFAAEEMQQMLQTVNENRCSPPLEEKEVQKIAQSVERYEPSDPITNGQADSGGAPASGERYITKDGRIIYVKPKGDGEEKWSVVANFMAKIEREITREDGTRLYRISGYSPEAHRAFEFDIEADEFESNQALKGAIGSAAGAEAPVRAGMTRHLAPALKMLSSDVEQRHRYKRTGWSDHGFILPGRMGEKIEVELPDSLTYKADPEAEVGQGRVALDNLIRSLGPKKTAPVLTFALTGPVVRHVEAMKRHGMFIKGRTGSLKTSVAQALMCIYGPGFIRDENLLKMGEGMTRNAAMALASSAHDLPILFDNYKPSTGRGDRDFINLIHNVIEGGEKARLNRNAQLKDRRDIRAWPLITGEDLPNSDPASLARVLAVEFKWNSGEDNPELTKAQENHPHLAAIGREWIKWLHTDEGQEILSNLEETFPERRKKWTAFLRKRRPDMVNILRVASNLATSTLVYDAAKRCPPLREVLGEHEDDYRDGLGTIAYRMGDYTCESLEARRLLKGIKSLRAAGRVNFAKRLGTDHYEDENRIGYWDEDGYYLILDLAIEAVEELYQRTDGLGGVTAQTLCSQLKDIELVARTGRSRTTRTVRVGDGKRQRVLHLKKEALEEPEDTDE